MKVSSYFEVKIRSRYIRYVKFFLRLINKIFRTIVFDVVGQGIAICSNFSEFIKVNAKLSN